MSQSNKYELEMVIKEGTYHHPCNRSMLYVATAIDGAADEEDKTDLVKIDHERIVWNKHISKTFSTLESPTPVMISMSMYKKKHFKKGFKLIGTAHFSLAELFPILNKPTVQGKIQLNMKKNCTATSTFLLALTLKSSSPPSPASYSQKVATMLPFSVVATAVEEDEKVKCHEGGETSLVLAEAVFVTCPIAHISKSDFDWSFLLGHVKNILLFLFIAQIMYSGVHLVAELRN